VLCNKKPFQNLKLTQQFAVFTAAQLSGKLKNHCFMVFRPGLMAYGAKRASGARITTPPTRRLSLTKKGTHWHPLAHVGARFPVSNGTPLKGGRAALIVNIFKREKFMFFALAVFILLWLIVDLFTGD
jgi:hypothetical protein